MIETRLLTYFLAVAREQNITKAAETLHITQSTLSKQMMDLEFQLGKSLFVYHFIRNPRKRWCFQRFRNLGVGLFPCFFPYGEK